MRLRSMRRVTALAVLAALVLSGLAYAAGGSTQARSDLFGDVKAKGSIRAGIYNFPPYSSLDTKGNWSGLLGQITAKISAALGFQVKTQVLQPAAYIPALDSGRVDVVVGISKTAERAKAAVFSTQILYAPDAMAVKDDGPIKKLSDIDGKTVGVVRGAYGETLTNILIKRGAIKPGKLVTYDTYSTPLLDITNGRIDANVSDVIGIQYAMQQNPKLKLRAVYIPPKAEGVQKYDSLYYVFSKKKDAATLIAAINKTIARMMKDGTFAAIYKSYGLGQYTKALLTGIAGS
jgi:polar amino acid transport system substrate-binding protein